MRYWTLIIGLLMIAFAASAKEKTELVKTSSGWELRVNGKPFYVKGVTWSHTPVGFKYDYNLYAESDEKIRAVLERDMTMLRAAGGNVIRGIPPLRWAKYINEKYGIYFVLNDYYGRYGMMVDDVWVAQTNYQDQRVRQLLIERWKKLATENREAPGLIAYLIGNENNYGLEWKSAEIENLPVGEQHAAKAKHLYSLFNEIALEIKKIDPDHPVGIVNGDIQYLDLIIKECPAIDFLGTNVYRGYDYTDLFTVVKSKLNKPVMVTETGCDAYDAAKQQENQLAQGEYIYRNWVDLYRNTGANGGAGNCIGALAFEFADEWWKHGQSVNLRVHDTTASWRNTAFQYDIAAGNNMNEEWFGLCSIREEEVNGIHLVTPRAAYFVLKDLWQYNPYTMGKGQIAQLKYTPAGYLKEAAAAEAKTNELLKVAKIPDAQPAPKHTLPAYVYREAGDRESWFASGYMGDTGAIVMNGGCTEQPRSGKTCMKVTFSKNDGWGGVFWQDPPNDWGDGQGGFDLTGAKKLTFWARGKNGGEMVKFGFGGIGKDKRFFDTAGGEVQLTLGKDWKQFTLDLAGKDLTRIKSGFMWVASGQGKPVEFYLDDIVYE